MQLDLSNQQFETFYSPWKKLWYAYFIDSNKQPIGEAACASSISKALLDLKEINS